MVTPLETFTNMLSTLCIVCREGKKKERTEHLILYFYQMSYLRGAYSMTGWEDEINESIYERCGIGPCASVV